MSRYGVFVILLVTLERNPPRALPALEKALDEGSTYFWPVMRNVWLVDSVEEPAAWHSRLQDHITEADSLLIIQVQPPYSGWLQEEVWTWLRHSEEKGDF